MSMPPLRDVRSALQDPVDDIAAPVKPSRRTMAAVRVPLVVALGAVAVAVGAALGFWYLPFVAGLAVGVAGRRGRAGFAAAVTTQLALGPLAWGAVLLARALAGDTVAGTARTVAALAGLPPFAAITVALTLLIALGEVASGVWLGRELSPRSG